MFGRKPTQTSELDKTISQVHNQLEDETPESEEFAQMVDQLVKLYPLRSNTTAWRVSPDTLATVVGNLLGILAIVEFERMGNVTSKALQFGNKLRS